MVYPSHLQSYCKCLNCGVKGCWDPKPGILSYLPCFEIQGEQHPIVLYAHSYSLNQNTGARELDKLQLACVASNIVACIIVCLVHFGVYVTETHTELG